MRGHGGGIWVVVVVGICCAGGFFGSRDRGAAVDAGAFGAGAACVRDGAVGTSGATVMDGAGTRTVGWIR
jgi:hypothetical protein